MQPRINLTFIGRRNIGILVIITSIMIIGIFLYHVRYLPYNCRFTLKAVILEIGCVNENITNVTLCLWFKMDNEGPSALTLNKVIYDLYINDIYVGHDNMTQRINIPPYSYRHINQSIPLSYLKEVVWDNIVNGTVEVRGVAFVDTFLGSLNISFNEKQRISCTCL